MATLILEHSDLAGSGRLGEVLRDHGHRLKVVRAHRGDPVPDDLDGIDAIVSCGGAPAPDDDSIEWIGQEMDLLRAAHAAALPIVGICMGCQVLARALGGEVAKLEAGIDCGWTEVRLTPVGREDPVFAGIAWKGMQISWHRYHVSKPPDGARVLASSARTPVEAWALGLRAYGFQYHPEATPDVLESWADDEPQALEEAGITRERLREETRKHYATSARLAERLFGTIALCVMPLDRRYAGAGHD